MVVENRGNLFCLGFLFILREQKSPPIEQPLNLKFKIFYDFSLLILLISDF
jgi:hypothetical protein